MTRSELDNLERLHEAATKTNSALEYALLKDALLELAPALIAMAEKVLGDGKTKLFKCTCDVYCEVFYALRDGVWWQWSPGTDWIKPTEDLLSVTKKELSPTESAAFLAKHPIPTEVSRG